MTNTNGFHLAGVSGGVVLELQSSNINPIKKTKINGYLICTFSNPLVGVIKSKVSLFKSTSVQPEATRDMLLEQYWNMNDFEQTFEETYGNMRGDGGDQRQGSKHQRTANFYDPITDRFR